MTWVLESWCFRATRWTELESRFFLIVSISRRRLRRWSAVSALPRSSFSSRSARRCSMFWNRANGSKKSALCWFQTPSEWWRFSEPVLTLLEGFGFNLIFGILTQLWNAIFPEPILLIVDDFWMKWVATMRGIGIWAPGVIESLWFDPSTVLKTGVSEWQVNRWKGCEEIGLKINTERKREIEEQRKIEIEMQPKWMNERPGFKQSWTFW